MDWNVRKILKTMVTSGDKGVSLNQLVTRKEKGENKIFVAVCKHEISIIKSVYLYSGFESTLEQDYNCFVLIMEKLC